MKTLLITLAMTLFISQVHAQDPSANAATATDDLKTRVTTLEKSVEDAKVEATKLQDKSARERYKSSLTLIRSGLVNGTRIEDILPLSMKLLTMADVTTILADLNNPTSKTLGTSFSEMAISSASKNLLPKSGNTAENQNVESRFKTILGAIINNPVVQSLANSNPITGTINTIIQQAGLFQNKTPIVKLTEQQIRDRRDISLAVDFQKPIGPDFNETQINDFYDEIKDRIDFYVELNELNAKHADTIKQLQIDARVIKRGIKANTAEICNQLGLPLNNYIALLDSQYDTQDINKINNFLKDTKFTEAVSLSIKVQEQLPDVLDFKNSVVSAISNYIEDYIKILERYKNNANMKFLQNNVDNTIKLLKAHKKTFTTS